MNKEETFPLDFTLIDKWKSTGEEKYLEEWLQSNWAYNAAVRISRQKKLFNYSTIRDNYIKVGKEWINPEMISYVYLGIRYSANKWDENKEANFNTWITNGAVLYVNQYIARDEASQVSSLDKEREDNGHSSIYMDLVASDTMDYEHLRAERTLEVIVGYALEHFSPSGLKYYLHYINGSSQKEISDIYGVSHQVVSASILKSNAIIQDNFKDQWMRGDI